MTSPKSVSWSALVNVGNNESIALTVSGEAANPDEARDIFAFACGQLLGVANSADEDTAPMIRAYVSRLVQTEEARPVVQEAPAPAPEKEPWEPKITKPSYDKMQEERKSAPTPPSRVPTAKEQAAAAVRSIIKPPAAPQPVGSGAAPVPTAPPEPEASAPAEGPTAPPIPKPAPEGEVCERCGAGVSKSQAKLSQLFLGKTLCKTCMEAP